MAWHTSSTTALAVGVITLYAVGADVPPTQRTADLADSWLVLYNSSAESGSPAWKDWYIQQWGIPAENTLGLNVNAEERITRDHFHSNIFYPVRGFLNANAALKAKIMGIIVGYRVPGNFYLDDTHPPLQGGGGWSVSNNLTDLVYSTWYKRSNAHAFVAYSSPNSVRLTKAALGEGCYLTARLDGPTLADVQALTLRAKAISDSSSPLPGSEGLYYDYLDIGSPPGDEWPALRATLESQLVTTPEWRFPWTMYESETESMPSCALSFSYYRITGWDTVPWSATPPGTRILALAMNSWGATTVRSTTGHGGRFVSNALVNGQFAAAAGATAEPYMGAEPNPSTIVWCLAEGRTLAEAFFHANPYRNYMWEMVGDPFLRVPQWFIDPCQSLPPPGELGPADVVAGGEIVESTPTLAFSLASRCGGSPVAFHLQIDQDSDFSSPEVDFISEPLVAGPAAFTIGQPSGGGVYLSGQEGQQLPLGGYYWRVRSQDGIGLSEWIDATTAGPAFAVGEPLRVVRAVSRKTHDSIGELDIDLALPPYTGLPTVESRRQGTVTLVLTFNKVIRPADDLIDGDEVEFSAGSLTEISTDGNMLIMGLSSVPDQTCLMLTLSGISDLAGRPVNGENWLKVALLEGDANQGGAVNSTDYTAIKNRLSEPATSETAHLDINLSGLIGTADYTAVKNALGNQVVCP